MKPGRFEYVAARSVAEAVDALGAAEAGSVLAGGQSLVPLLNLRLARPDVVVDVNGISELEAAGRRNGAVRFGALYRQRWLESAPMPEEYAPLLAEAAALIGHVPIRNRGTIGGSLAHADPASELPAALVALEGEVVVKGLASPRRIPASELFVGPLTTSVRPGELLTAVEVPARVEGDGAAFAEFARRHGDFAVAGVAVALHREAGGTCTRARAAGCGLGPTPVGLSAAVAGLVGESELDDDLLRGMAEQAAAGLDPPGDVHGSPDYRRELAQVLLVRGLRAAWSRAGRAAEGRGG